jgi:hypothetical protein
VWAVASCRRSVRYLLSVDVGSSLPYKCSQLCAPENYSRIAKLITDTLNEDVAYSTQPIELRNQRVYAIKVTIIGVYQVPSMLTLLGWRQWLPRRCKTNIQRS